MKKLICPGIGKSGSTYLFNLLLENQLISKSSIKEINFFSDNSMTEAEYKKLIERSGSLFVDFSVRYLLTDKATKNMLDYFKCSQTKYLVLLREPHALMRSDYHHMCRKQGKLVDPDIFFDKKTIELLAIYQRIRSIQETEENLFVIESDTLFSNPEAILESLGLKIKQPFIVSKSINKGFEPKVRLVEKLIHNCSVGLRKFGAHDLHANLSKSKILFLIRRANSQPIMFDPMENRQLDPKLEYEYRQLVQEQSCRNKQQKTCKGWIND